MGTRKGGRVGRGDGLSREAPDGRPLWIPRPGGHLPRDAGERLVRAEDAAGLRAAHRRSGEGGATRTPAARARRLLAPPAERGNAPVLEGLRQPRALGPLRASCRLVEGVPPRLGRDGVLARGLLHARRNGG